MVRQGWDRGTVRTGCVRVLRGSGTRLPEFAVGVGRTFDRTVAGATVLTGFFSAGAARSVLLRVKAEGFGRFPRGRCVRAFGRMQDGGGGVFNGRLVRLRRVPRRG